MLRKFRFMDPETIMAVVISLVVLAVGVFAFFVTVSNIPNQDADHPKIWSAINNTTDTGNSVFNIVGIVLIIGAIMTIIGVIYGYVKP